MPRALIYANTKSRAADAPITRLVVHQKLNDCSPALQDFPKEALKGSIRNLPSYIDDISKQKDESAIRITIPKSKSFWIWLSISDKDTGNTGDRDWMKEYVLDRCSIEIEPDLKMELHG
jgi:hypothetical protein